MLVYAVVVAGDDACSDVGTGADDRITEIGEVVGLGAFAERGFLCLNKVADVGICADVALRADVAVGAELCAVTNDGIGEDAAVADENAFTDNAVFNNRVRTDAAVGADLCFAEKLREWLQNGVCSDFHAGVDGDGLGAEDGYALRHQLGGGAIAQAGVEVHHFRDGVGAEDFVDGISGDGDDAFFIVDHHGRDVREIELAGGVGVLQAAEAVKELLRIEGVDAAVDLAQALGCGEHVIRERLLFDDARDIIGAILLAQDAAVACGVVRDGREDGHGSVFAQMRVAQLCDGLRADERDVAGEDEKIFWRCDFVGMKPLLYALESVAGAKLFGLEDEAHTRGGGGCFDAVCLMAHNDKDVFSGNGGLCCVDDVQQQSLAADGVEDLGERTLQAGTFTRSHDDNAEVVHVLMLRRETPSWDCDPLKRERLALRRTGGGNYVVIPFMPLMPSFRCVTPAGFRVLLQVALLGMLPGVAFAQDGRTALPQVRSAALQGTDSGEVADSQKVPSISITLKRTAAQQADLDAFLSDVRTKGNSQYHQWLTPDAFAKRFAPSADAVAQVTTWLQAQGLQVTSVAAGGMRLNVSGTARQTETAFAVSLHRMALAAGDAVTVTGAPSVPDALASAVESVSGLDATAASPDAVATLAGSVDANTSAVLTADLSKTSVSMEELTTVLEQAAAQGQTVVLTGASDSLVPERALLIVKQGATAADDSDDETPRPDWQAAQGLPADGLRATPDAAVTDVAALATGLASVATTSGRQGEIASRFYQVAPEPGVFTHADSSVADGTWAASDGLGTVNVDKLVKALAVGSTNPLSSVIVLSSRDLTHGQSITLTATITGGSGTPMGTITFASAQGGTLGSAAMTNGVATYSTSSLAGGQYGFYGTYNGDSTYASSTTNVDTATIGAEAAKVVAGVNGTPLVGTTMAVSVGVSSTSGVGTPSGTVTVWPYGTAIASSSFTGMLGASTSSQATASVSVPATNAGTFNFQANCTTDASFSCYTPITFSVTVGKGAPAMKLTQTGTSSAAVLTATVTSPTTAGTGTVAPTGSVQFLDNGTAIGSGSLNSSGVATYTGALGSGTTHVVTATFGGDGNYNTATATANATTKVTPSVVLAVVTAGTSLSATVTPPSGTSTIPTGTVQFLDGSTTLGTATLNGSGVGTYTGSYTSGTGHILTAVYVGDTNFNTATSNAIDTSKILPTVTLTKTASSPTDGTVGLSVAVTSTSSTTATGTVSFMDGTTKIGTGTLSASGGATYAGSMATTGTSTSSSTKVRPFVTSTVTHTLTAVYGGDTNFNSATSNAVTADATTTLIATSTALTSSSGYTGAYGTSFTLNVVVTPSSYVTSGAAPSGTVTISDASGVVGTGTLSAGSASIAISTLTVGSHALTATYGGDTNYAASTSSPAVTITITPVTATITATISPTGSVPYGYNANITVNASASSGGVAPAGTVTATVSGNNGTYTGTLTATGVGATTSTASIAFPVPQPGKYTITITCNTNITCNTASVSLTTTQGYTKTTITGAPSSPQAGVPVSISATVANSGTGTGTYTYSGTVSFYANNKLLGKGAVANGVATASVTFPSATSMTVTAIYSGDTNWSGSTSDAITVLPLPLDAAVTVTSSTTNGIVGQNITLTATATASISTATLVPSGTVTFYDTYGGSVVNLGSASLLSNGLNTSYASLSTTGLRAGSHSIFAIYSGDTVFNKETAAAIAVNMGDFSMSFTPSSATVSQGGSAQINLVVAGASNFSGTIALGCTAPAGTETTCSINPASVATGSTAVITITTTKAAASSKSASRIAMGASAAGVFALLLMGARRRRVAALLMLLLAVGLMSGGCGEDSTANNGGGTTDSGTPLGTLTFQVTGTAVDAPVSARRTAAVSVTVQ